MEILLWMLILAYIFGIGYLAAVRLSSFIGGNPKAFPGSRKIVVMPPRIWPHHFEDDGIRDPWYNNFTNLEEFESQ